MDYQHIRTDLDEKILTITLNRPDRLNAFTLRMKDELVHAFGEADQVPALCIRRGLPDSCTKRRQLCLHEASPSLSARAPVREKFLELLRLLDEHVQVP